MFELLVALKYLIPRRKQLSVSLIALLSVMVISLVVWLVLVFLSVTEGIERGWLQKLTTLNAPLRITPTHHYYSSYYYQIDSISSRSDYSLKNIAEKAQTENANPYNPLEDGELPVRFPQPDLTKEGALNDPVKGLFEILSDIKQSHSDLVFQDFELSGALLRLQLLRPGNGIPGTETQGYLTQVSYLTSLPDQCPRLSSLLLPPREKDLNHLLYLALHSTELSRQDSPALTLKAPKETAQNRIQTLLQHVNIKQLKPHHSFWQVPSSFLPLNQAFEGIVYERNGSISRIDLPLEKGKGGQDFGKYVKIWKNDSNFILEDEKGRQQKLSLNIPLLVDGPILFDVENVLETAPPLFRVCTSLQGISFKGTLGIDGMEIVQANLLSQKLSPATPWISPQKLLPVNEEKETGVLLAKSFLDNGVMIGDRGYLSYASTTSSAVQEHRLPIFVSGFYDPGILSVGNKCILVPPFVTRTINASSTSFNLDKTQSNGILVWFDDLREASEIKNEILIALKNQDLDKYWKVTTFRDYEFAKDLLEQFQSDKYLFALVGVIILVVACCNIISLLVLLVNDKKREIGILQAMGASNLSIAVIFGSCGMAMGILSSIIGTVAAVLTLHHIDVVVQFLSFIQGQNAFNTTFFGKSLPDTLSHNALTFILTTTPLLSLLAGLVPAIKACRLRPSAILRSE
jgi:lipoprotein-releasing system permease protein